MREEKEEGVGSPPWNSRGNYRLPDLLPVIHRYPDGARVVGWPGSWQYEITDRIARQRVVIGPFGREIIRD